ncbi:MAG: hypothetical protein ACREPM_13870 [Gemmatimonadaceae bacterium]
MPVPVARRCARIAAAVLCVLAPSIARAQVRINLGAWHEPILLDTLRQDHALRAAPDKVYEATLRAFADLEIPTGRTDGKAGIIGSERFEKSHALGNLLLARLYECGDGPTGPYADSFRLEIAVVAWVSPDGTGSKLGLATIASARDVSGVEHNPRACSSSGTLETKILERVTKLTGG